ncbi:hypothetical protein BC938DRAFT_477333 [Jimgerdemannia flammicorona]|uniref:SPIN90/Ldb17 leucine-rich domain-containing protein n=1 Tax=Jimgerdemannia flammicorona TaxID=994334 RepID=A0A433QPG0_9FUNG|nr:hypothetical protein BC938DRAFT_477333 [Jimgerdemannia flammicorona]
MDDVYHHENLSHFHAELDDVLAQGDTVSDPYVANNILSAFVGFLVAFQDDYLQTPTDLATAIYKLLDSPLYLAHHDTIIPHLVRTRALISSNPRDLYIAYGILLYAGRDNVHVLPQVIIETASTGTANKGRGKGNKLFAKLKHEVESFLGGQKMQTVAIELMFELCRVSRWGNVDLEGSKGCLAYLPIFCLIRRVLWRRSPLDLCKIVDHRCEEEETETTGGHTNIISSHFIHHLLLLVESTHYDADESFNYNIIKLLLAFSEQFMMMQAGADHAEQHGEPTMPNRVLDELANNMGNIKTFGQNLIFMLNRAGERGFLLKLDQIIVLRNTYLRVLTPLLVNTQIRHTLYKRDAIHRALRSLIATHRFVTVNATTQRLVRRVLVEWWGGVCGGAIGLEDEEEQVTVTGMEEKGKIEGTPGMTSVAMGGVEEEVDRGVVCA